MLSEFRLTRRNTVVGVTAWFLLICSGCGDVDWNWDLAWWEKPKRVVRPIRPQSQQEHPQTAPATTMPGTDERPAIASPAPDRPASSRRSAQQPSQEPTANADRGDSGASVPQAPPAAGVPLRGGLPFYQLYLAGGSEAREEQPGERRLNLKEASARACAGLLELLYVPMGRSGSAEECYLIYENANEFQAAVSLAPRLDLTPQGSPAATVGLSAAFDTGISQMLWILGQGAVVDSRMLDDCERHLVEALQSTQLPANDRWIAGIMAGRLASEFKYDYASALSYYRQAEKAASDDPMMRMTALWWYADTLAQEGKAAEARDVYRAITTDYNEWKGCQIVRRSHAKLDEKRKR
jgi:hypothetical protein